MKRNLPKKNKMNRQDFSDLFAKSITDMEQRSKIKMFWKDVMHSIITSPVGKYAPDKVKKCALHFGSCDCIEYRYHINIHALYTIAFELVDLISAIADIKLEKNPAEKQRALSEYPFNADNLLAIRDMLRQAGVWDRYEEMNKIME